VNNSPVERPERTTLVLTSEINSWLDGQRAAMRKKTGTCMSRSELLRAMVRSASEVPGLSFENCQTEEHIGLEMFCGGFDEEAPNPLRP
jgi:hypothetical protein